MDKAIEIFVAVHEAIEIYRALLDDQTRVLGLDTRDTIRTRTHLADDLGQTGRLDDAIQKSRVVINDQMRMLGPDDLTPS